MTRQFNVGDRVKFVGYNQRTTSQPAGAVFSTNTLPVGTEGVIVAPTQVTLPGYVRVDFAVKPECVGALLDGTWQCLPAWLKHIYDGDEPAKWSDCVWQPSSLRVC